MNSLPLSEYQIILYRIFWRQSKEEIIQLEIARLQQTVAQLLLEFLQPKVDFGEYAIKTLVSLEQYQKKEIIIHRHIKNLITQGSSSDTIKFAYASYRALVYLNDFVAKFCTKCDNLYKTKEKDFEEGLRSSHVIGQQEKDKHIARNSIFFREKYTRMHEIQSAVQRETGALEKEQGECKLQPKHTQRIAVR